MDAPRKMTPTPPWASVDVSKAIVLGWRNDEAPDAAQVQIQANLWNSSAYYVASNGSISLSGQTLTISGTDSTATIAANALTATAEGYKWRVRSRSAATGSWSPWSYYSHLSTTLNPPTVSLLEPSAQFVTSNHTRVLFSFDGGTRDMIAIRVRQYLSGSAVFDTNELYATAKSGEQYSYIIEDYTNLSFTNYTVGVMAKSDQGVWSSEATRSFVSTPIGLMDPTINVRQAGETVLVSVDASGVGKTVLSQRLYRYNPVLDTDTLIYTVTGSTISYTDLAYPLNTSFRYLVEVVATDGTSQRFESAAITVTDDHWYIVNNGNRIEVVAEEFQVEHAARTDYLEPLGRSRSVAFKMETEGRDGTLSIAVSPTERTALLASIFAIYDNDEDSYIVSPNGDVLRVRFMSPDITDGVGGETSVVLKFSEVAAS